MGFNKKVIKLLKEKRKTKAQLAKAAGIPYTTLDSMLKRDSDATRLATIFKIAEYLDVAVEDLVFDDRTGKSDKRMELSDSEIQLIENYRLIDDRGRGSLQAMAGYEASRVRNEGATLSRERVRRIPVYMSPAAAGEPLPILADDYSLVKADAPEEANFGIKISGDSMSPLIEDLSVVWVKRQDSLESGDIGVFVLNGESLCKRLEYTSGGCRLVSVNTKYKPIEILESDDLRVVGRVIL